MTELVASAGRKRSKPGPLTQLMFDVYTNNGWLMFATVCAISLLFTWFLNSEVLTDQVYYTSLSGKLKPESLIEFVQDQHKSRFLGYFLVPLMLCIKIGLVSICLLAGLSLTSRKLPFRTLCKIAVFAELAFSAGLVVKLFLLCFFREVDTLDQYTSFAPFSVYGLLNPSSVPSWLTYPLQTLDLFQVCYVLMLAVGLSYYLRKPVKQMAWLVVGSYGIGLLLCMIGFAFFKISTS